MSRAMYLPRTVVVKELPTTLTTRDNVGSVPSENASVKWREPNGDSLQALPYCLRDIYYWWS